MQIIVVGSGPVGSLCATMLARRGHRVLLVDRDRGPLPEQPWKRRGVMQFNLPHFFRPLVRQAIVDEVPELWTALLMAGALPARPPGFPEEMTGVQCRRSVFERVLWNFTTAEPCVTRRLGTVADVVTRDGRVRGISVDGRQAAADLVIVASGRSGHLGDRLRAPAEGGPCGFSYAARQYRARPGVPLPDWGMPRRVVHDGYEAIVFPQDGQTLCALIVRPTTDSRLAPLRHNSVFSAAAAAIPLLSEWTDPERFEPITDVLAGSNLHNAYRGQLGPDGAVTPGILFLGDAVCTTNPAAGRGVALGMQQAMCAVRSLDSFSDVADAALKFDQWCEEQIRPWYEDHVYWDSTELRRFSGQDLDLSARIPSDVVCEAAQVDPAIMTAAGPYLGMLATPRILDGVQDRARAVLASGWRPSYASGPSRDDLAEIALAAA